MAGNLKCSALVALLLAVAPLAAEQSPEKFVARLSTVPIDVPMMATVAGTGSVTAVLSGSTVTVTGKFDGLRSPATVARLHRAPRGLQGPAVHDLVVEKSVTGNITGTIALKPNELEDLRNGRLYILLHSERAPEGNLWGWLFAEGRRQ